MAVFLIRHNSCDSSKNQQPASVADPDSGSDVFLIPGSGMGKKSGSGSGMNNRDPISESLETSFGVKILKFFDADPGSGIFLTLDPGWKKFGSGMKIPDPQHCSPQIFITSGCKIYLLLSILGGFFYFAPLFRPAWEEGWTRERLEMNEQRSFREYVTRHSRL
jgi:hypothetical protein